MTFSASEEYPTGIQGMFCTKNVLIDLGTGTGTLVIAAGYASANHIYAIF
jgi:predicted RNA methylase